MPSIIYWMNTISYMSKSSSWQYNHLIPRYTYSCSETDIGKIYFELWFKKCISVIYRYVFIRVINVNTLVAFSIKLFSHNLKKHFTYVGSTHKVSLSEYYMILLPPRAFRHIWNCIYSEHYRLHNCMRHSVGLEVLKMH